MARFFWNDWQWIRRANASCDAIDADAFAIVCKTTDAELSRVHFAQCVERLPRRMHKAAARLYAREYAKGEQRKADAEKRGEWEEGGTQAANDAALDLRDAFSVASLDLAASDSDIREFAEECARAVSRMLADRTQVATTSDTAEKIARYCRGYGVEPPEAQTLAGIVARALCPRWWRRRLRRGILREIERQAVKLGMVHRRASIYASAEAVARRRQQLRRNARILGSVTAENDDGQVFTIAELASVNVSNPQVRRAELMTRIAGFEEYARARGDVAMFYTWTCPSRMHARLAESGAINPKHDGTSAREAQQYLCRQWSKARAKLHRAQVVPYGLRVAEPHHDGTPHWHLLLFLPKELEQAVTEVMRHYANEADEQELSSESARKARFWAKRIDPEEGSAVGYVAKYVAKNVDGFRVGDDGEARPGVDAAETVTHCDAWAATWGIRQFQQIGGPSVTIWRELRRLRESPQLPLFEAVHEAANAGNWRGFVRLMGGIYTRRRDRPVSLWRDGPNQVTRYGDKAPPKVEGVTRMLEHCRTRLHDWQIGASPPGVGSPWTRVNNCTRQ